MQECQYVPTLANIPSFPYLNVTLFIFYSLPLNVSI